MRTVVGVIGHVDHGKTALVRALTGMETDRLEEERRRGISIALGFAYLPAAPDSSSGSGSIDLIDMPGHERFVRTMVSGATGVDAVLLVVAANEGIMPQTREHLDIAGLLGIGRAVVAITKADLVTAAEADAAAQETAALARQAGLHVLATVLTSATTGQGIDRLRTLLTRDLPGQAPGTPSDKSGEKLDGFPYLPIDRVFSMAGHGTIVTGTLRRGPLAVSDEVSLVPEARRVRLRGLQVHGARASQVQPGQRVAANLRDVEPGQLTRGAALTAAGLLPPSKWLTVSLRAVPDSPTMSTTTKWSLLFGTEEVEARLRLLDCDELQPGQFALAQLRCAAPVSVPGRERFILRRLSPPQTVAGGRIIDSAATRLRRHAPGVIARLSKLRDAEPSAIVQAEVEAAGAAGIPLARLAQLAGVSEARAADMLQRLPAVLGARSRVAVLRVQFDRTLAAIPGALGPYEDGLPPDRLATELSWAGRAVLDDALAELVRRGAVRQAGGTVRLHAPQRDRDRADQESASAARLAEALRQGGLSPPDPSRVAPGPQTKRLVDRLVREGTVVRAVDKVQHREFYFHAEAVETAKRQLAPLLSKAPGLLVGEAGATLGISRKYCVPLLEHLDTIRFTTRIADRRMLAHKG